MASPTLEFIDWLIFFKYEFIIGFWKRLRMCFQDTENVFNDIVVNKLKTVDPIYLSKLFYFLN